jgi:hypothetical protein
MYFPAHQNLASFQPSSFEGKQNESNALNFTPFDKDDKERCEFYFKQKLHCPKIHYEQR